jgi:hypothetical protein
LTPFRSVLRVLEQALCDQDGDGRTDVVDIVADARSKIIEGQKHAGMTQKEYQDVEIAWTAEKVQQNVMSRLGRLQVWVGSEQARDGPRDHCSRVVHALLRGHEQPLRIVALGLRPDRHEVARGTGRITASNLQLRSSLAFARAFVAAARRHRSCERSTSRSRRRPRAVDAARASSDNHCCCAVTS